jgi:hypothetical protein
VLRGQTIYINVTVENQGDFLETFDVIVYADELGGKVHMDIGNKTISLDVGASTILEFTWNTTGVPQGNYWITAEAVLPEDNDPDDNIARTLIGGIFDPWHKPEADTLTLLIPIAMVILFAVTLGMVAIGFFKILMSPRIKWPLRYDNSSRAPKEQGNVIIRDASHNP